MQHDLRTRELQTGAVRADNVTLLQKIRYLESYRPGQVAARNEQER
jgi:hypothetical protein